VCVVYADARRIGGSLKWLTCGTEFIVADVIRWREPVWKPQARASKKKPSIIGQRCVTGQIVRIDRAGWVHIKVVVCTAEPAPHWLRPLPPPARQDRARQSRPPAVERRNRPRRRGRLAVCEDMKAAGRGIAAPRRSRAYHHES